MAGLLDTQRQGGGLLGLSEPQKAGFFDYALAALAGGGLSGAAALGMQQRQQRRQYDSLQPVMQELSDALQPREEMSFKAPQQLPNQGLLSMAPTATERNGVLSRQLQAEPALTGAPTAETRSVAPTLAELAPALLKAQASGLNTSPITGLLSSIREEQEASRPRVYNTARGLLSIGRDGESPEMLWTAPDDPRDGVSPGWEWADADKKTQRPIKGGPYDLDYIGSAAGTRRDEIIKRPTPSRAKAGGGGGGTSSGLPPGYQPR